MQHRELFYLKKYIADLVVSGCDWLHIDIFDGIVVPSRTFPLSIIGEIGSSFPDLFLDVHLCVRDQVKESIIAFEHGASQVILQSPSLQVIREVKSQARCLVGASVGISEDIDFSLLEHVDHINIMTIEAGYGGKAFEAENLAKLELIRGRFSGTIGIDGGVNRENAKLCLGADVVVIGTALRKAYECGECKELIEYIHGLQAELVDLRDCLKFGTRHVPYTDITDEFENKVRELGQLIQEESILKFRARVSAAQRGEDFIFCAGECSEPHFDLERPDVIELKEAMGDRWCNVYRAAGQTLKPRSQPGGFWGLCVNSPEDLTIRPELYFDTFLEARQRKEILKGFTGHEILLTAREIANTVHGGSGWYNSISEFIWVGNKTRDGSQLEYASQVTNVVGLKLGSGVSVRELLTYISKLNPKNTPGRLVLIPRCGVKEIESCLSDWLKATVGMNILWMLDPMRGNTELLDGVKIRYMDDILEELRLGSLILSHHGSRLGGIMLEMTARDVDQDECCWRGSVPSNRRYYSLCDPCLTHKQLHEVMETLAKPVRTAFILAKSNSLGLSKKHLASFGERSLLEAGIDKLVGIFDDIYVSTDSEEYAKVAERCGVGVIRRPIELTANDSYCEAIRFTCQEIERQRLGRGLMASSTYTVLMCVQPFISRAMILDSLQCSGDGVVSVETIDFHPSWLMRDNQPISVSDNVARSNDLCKITNGVVTFRAESLHRWRSCTAWPFLGYRIRTILPETLNKNFVGDINTYDDLVWCLFCRDFPDWWAAYFRKRLEGAESGLLTDILDEMGYDSDKLTIKGLRLSINSSYFGRVRTLRLRECTDCLERIDKGLGFISDLGAADVLVVQGSDKFAYFGQLMTRLCVRQGVSGVLIHGYTRDTSFSSELAVHYSGVTPVDIKGRGQVESTDCRIQLGHVQVDSYDYIFGDRDAAVVLPREIIHSQEFWLKVAGKLAEEVRIKGMISEGKTIQEILRHVKEF